MSGFDATLSQLCAGTTSVEAALAAFHRERPDHTEVLLHFRMIEAAWQQGKLDRRSYDVLRSAALARSAGLAADRQPSEGMKEASIASRSRPSQQKYDREDSLREDSLMEMREQSRTRLHSRPADSPSRPALSEAEPPRASAARLTNPSQWSREAVPPLAPGSVLKQRFVLERIIGRGGMGTIFCARDLRKEEAQDRHPYVAVKVLNEDFRQHPEALISLQRESRKAQTLAHPNIATVYDFDRDGPVVFLVMELLEGVSLNDFIKSRVSRPLPQAEALRIVQALGAALAHAHQKGLVHADFKPANAFRTHDGTVKVLDFGIARAIGRRSHDGEHTDTVFDPAKLGALTPCYASPEMLVGDVPDPRDDVYALACVAYELFCSRHPFDFMSSQLAERRGLKPAVIPGLDRRICRALHHGLKFSRKSRTPSVDAFLAEMAPTHRIRSAAIAATLIATIGLGAVAWNLVPEYLNDWTRDRYTAQLQSRDPVAIDALLPRLLELPYAQREALFDDPATRDALLGHVQAKVRLASEHFDYEQAERYIAQLERIVPDATGAAGLRSDVATSRQRAIADAQAALDVQLQRGWLIDAQNADNAMRTLATLQRLDPQWRPDATQLNRTFIAQIRQALYSKKDLASATALVAAAKQAGVAGAELGQFDAAIKQRSADAVPPPPQPALARQTETQTPGPSMAATDSTPAAASAPPLEAAPPVAPATSAAAGANSHSSPNSPPNSMPGQSLSMEQLKQRLLALAAADDLTEALEVLRRLQGGLSPDDPFLTVDAPHAMAETYIRLSDRAFDDGQFESAAALLTRATEFDPDAPQIAERRESVDRVAHVAHTLEFVISFSPDRVIAELEHIEANEGRRFPLIRTQLAEILAQRINEAQSTAPQRADELLQAARRIFPGSPVFANAQTTAATYIAGP